MIPWGPQKLGYAVQYVTQPSQSVLLASMLVGPLAAASQCLAPQLPVAGTHSGPSSLFLSSSSQEDTSLIASVSPVLYRHVSRACPETIRRPWRSVSIRRSSLHAGMGLIMHLKNAGDRMRSACRDIPFERTAKISEVEGSSHLMLRHTSSRDAERTPLAFACPQRRAARPRPWRLRDCRDRSQRSAAEGRTQSQL